LHAFHACCSLCSLTRGSWFELSCTKEKERKNELQKIKEKVEPLRAQRARGLNESGGEEGLSPYDSFKEAFFSGGAFAD
jgi:hypothetical protein